MGIIRKLHEKQVSNVIFVALLLIFAAGVAAWWLSNRGAPSASNQGDEHPLTLASTVSLCKLLPAFAGTSECVDSEQQTNVAGHSIWSDANGIPVLRIDLISTINLSVAEPITSKAWLESVVPEIKASGRQDWEEPKGPWTRAAITRKDNEQELLFEDRGIIVVMQSNVFDRKTLLKHADQTATVLRKAKAVTSSADAATPK